MSLQHQGVGSILSIATPAASLDLIPGPGNPYATGVQKKKKKKKSESYSVFNQLKVFHLGDVG